MLFGFCTVAVLFAYGARLWYGRALQVGARRHDPVFWALMLGSLACSLASARLGAALKLSGAVALAVFNGAVGACLPEIATGLWHGMSHALRELAHRAGRTVGNLAVPVGGVILVIALAQSQPALLGSLMALALVALGLRVMMTPVLGPMTRRRRGERER